MSQVPIKEVKNGDYNIQYIEFQDKYLNQIIEMYHTNLPRTHKPQGYDFLTRPIKDLGLLKVVSFIGALFVAFYLVLFKIFSLSIIVSLFVILIHLYCFVIGEQVFIKDQYAYASMFIDGVLKKNPSKYFSDQNKLYIAVDKDKDLLVGMACYTVNFVNTLNLPENQTGEVSRVSVRKEYEGKGIAKLLIQIIEENAKKTNKKYLFLSGLNSNNRGMIFYQKCGFQLQPIRVGRPPLFVLMGIQIFYMKKEIQ